MKQNPGFRETRSFSVGDVEVGGGNSLFLIGGPCGIESRSLLQTVAGRLEEITDTLEMPYIFKSSYDKANRTSIDSFRGPGLEKGLEMLANVRNSFDVPVLSDVHCREHVNPASDVLDVIQIPAFLSRQTDLILAAADSGTALNIKKGQFLSPGDAEHILEKARRGGQKDVMVTERGTCFGYDHLVSDLRSIPVMQEFGNPVVFDATHSSQMPGEGGDQTGGSRRYTPAMARAAVAAGCDGLFMEIHPDPENARSDSATQLPLDRVKPLLNDLLEVRSSLESVSG